MALRQRLTGYNLEQILDKLRNQRSGLSDTPTCDSRTNMSSRQVNLQIHSPPSEDGAHSHLWLPSFLQPTRGCWQLITAATWGSHPARVRGLSRKYYLKPRMWRLRVNSALHCVFRPEQLLICRVLHFFFVLDVRKEIKSSTLKIHFQVVDQMSTETTLCRQFFGAWNDPNRPSSAETKEPSPPHQYKLVLIYLNHNINMSNMSGHMRSHYNKKGISSEGLILDGKCQ